MNQQDQDYLKELKEKYPDSFKGCRVLELGSGIINGSVRDYFEDNKEYIGVDFRKYTIAENGFLTLLKGVDVIAKASDTEFEQEQFDTIISYSMLEHDVEWKDSLAHNVQFLKKGGMMFLEWGGITMGAHGLDYGGFHPLSLREVSNYLKQIEMEVLDEVPTKNERYPKINARRL